MSLCAGRRLIILKNIQVLLNYTVYILYKESECFFLNLYKTYYLKVILYSFFILKKSNERITDS